MPVQYIFLTLYRLPIDLKMITIYLSKVDTRCLCHDQCAFTVGNSKRLKYFDVASRICMHSIVLTITLAALNDNSYMYAALWAHNFLLYPYKMYFHTFSWDKFQSLCVKLQELSRKLRNLRDLAKW